MVGRGEFCCHYHGRKRRQPSFAGSLDTIKVKVVLGTDARWLQRSSSASGRQGFASRSSF